MHKKIRRLPSRTLGDVSLNFPNLSPCCRPDSCELSLLFQAPSCQPWPCSPPQPQENFVLLAKVHVTPVPSCRRKVQPRLGFLIAITTQLFCRTPRLLKLLWPLPGSAIAQQQRAVLLSSEVGNAAYLLGEHLLYGECWLWGRLLCHCRHIVWLLLCMARTSLSISSNQQKACGGTSL